LIWWGGEQNFDENYSGYVRGSEISMKCKVVTKSYESLWENHLLFSFKQYSETVFGDGNVSGQTSGR